MCRCDYTVLIRDNIFLLRVRNHDHSVKCSNCYDEPSIRQGKTESRKHMEVSNAVSTESFGTAQDTGKYHEEMPHAETP